MLNFSTAHCFNFLNVWFPNANKVTPAFSSITRLNPETESILMSPGLRIYENADEPRITMPVAEWGPSVVREVINSVLIAFKF